MALGLASEAVAEEQEIDLTPLIDCFLMLIIFFSCLEFRSLEAKIRVLLPKAVGAGKVPAAPELTLDLAIESLTFGNAVARHPGASVLPNGELAGGHRLEGHAVRFRVGSKIVPDLATLHRTLGELARTEPYRVTTTDQGTRLVPLVIAPGQGTTYGDVALAVDAALGAGFEDLRFTAGSGPRR